MAVFSTNQNRQLYVVKSYNSATAAEVTNLGDLALAEVNGKQLYFKYVGQGGPMRSDFIDKDKVKWITYTEGSKDVTYLKTATIKVADAALDEGNLISGQDYIVRIYIHNYLAPGDAHTTIKYGAVHATKDMKPAEFYTKLAKSLTDNFSREATPLLTFTATEEGVKVEEVEQPWQLGTMSQETVNFDIMPATVTVDGDEVGWCVVDEKTGKVEVKYDGKEITNGKRMADLEYFCMGERGDQYRNVGWPNVIPTKYMIDPEGSYSTVTIHYAFSDSGVNNQNSEKEITFVGSTSDMWDLKLTLANNGLY